jgi:hypothetical protein
VLRGTGECFEKQEHDFMASIREVMCGAKRQGRIRCIVEIDSPSLVNFYISIKPILGFEHEPSEEGFFSCILLF